MDDDTSQIPTLCKVEAGLYIIATPIGNMGDITARALETLQQADVIACEDTRVSQKLLSRHGIKTKLVVYNDHSDDKTRDYLVELVAQGKSVALISDAGTPLISDPGYKLVREAQDQGLNVTSLPGPCSAVAAITLSGLPSNRFLFEGFLPPRSVARSKALLALKAIPATLIFFEAPHRLQETLVDMHEVFGNREVAVIREITKLFEEVKRDTLENLITYYTEAPRGEIVIVVAPPVEETTEEMLDDALRAALSQMSVKDAVSYVTEQTGLPKKTVYSRALTLKL